MDDFISFMCEIEDHIECDHCDCACHQSDRFISSASDFHLAGCRIMERGRAMRERRWDDLKRLTCDCRNADGTFIQGQPPLHEEFED